MAELHFSVDTAFQGVSRGYSFGNVHAFDLDIRHGDRLYAFAVTDKTRPQVFDYGPDDDGLASLANLIRSEEVVAIVQGRQADFELCSVVEVSVGLKTMRDRMPLGRSY